MLHIHFTCWSRRRDVNSPEPVNFFLCAITWLHNSEMPSPVSAEYVITGGNQFGDVFALDGRTLQTLWTFNVGTAIQAPPMTFSTGGKQYVGILAGGSAGPSQRTFRASTRWFTPSNYLFLFAL